MPAADEEIFEQKSGTEEHQKTSTNIHLFAFDEVRRIFWRATIMPLTQSAVQPNEALAREDKLSYAASSLLL